MASATSLTSVLVLLLLLVLPFSSSAPVPSSSNDRLIQLSPDLKLWLSPEQLDELDEARHKTHRLGVGYFDITDFQDPVTPVTRFTKRMAFPTQPAFQGIVDPLVAQVNPNFLRNTITTLSSFTNRYYTTTAGVQSAQYLRDHMQDLATKAGRTDANCTLFQHTWAQPSVICRIEGQGALASEVIVTGAHLDSLNSRATPDGVAPGADDDASGVASFVETFRILIENGFKPQRSIEFMGYAAEEVGLRGSQDIARSYANQGKNVYAVYQNEMSGYVEDEPAIVILKDYVDSSLTLFVESLVDTYCSIPSSPAVCGYGCSDHASWHNLDYPTVCTAEAGPFGNVNPNMHTAADTVDKLDMNFTAEFSKLALAFVVELSLHQA